MSIKALFTYNYGDDYMREIKELGYDIKIIHESKIEYVEEIADTEVLVCYHPFKTLDISRLEKLKYIQLSSTGFDQIPLEKLKEDTLICNNKGGYSIAIGEWIVMSILNLLKNTKRCIQNNENKRWKLDNSWLELYGKRVAFLGTGTLAREGAKRLSGFGVEITGFNTKGIGNDDIQMCYEFDQINHRIGEFDIVICTLPFTEATEGIIDEKIIGNMKDGVFFINASRGNVVVEEELKKALKSRKIKGAALDVFKKEPLPQNNELWDMDNVIISSHNSWVSEKRNERRLVGIIENLKRYAQGRDLINRVNINKGY